MWYKDLDTITHWGWSILVGALASLVLSGIAMLGVSFR